MSVSVRLSPFGNTQQFFDPKGNVLAGGTLSTYLAGTTTPATTYSDNGGVNTNGPVLTLGSDGRFAGAIWLQTGQAYKFVLADTHGVVLGTYNNIIGINDIQQGVSIPSGSVMIFQQPAASVGWTRISTFDDSVLRVVGSVPPASGGANGLSIVLGASPIPIGNHSITLAELPSHQHTMSFNSGTGGNTSQVALFQAATPNNPQSFTTNNNGGGLFHSHNMNAPNVKYVDVILCSKN